MEKKLPKVFANKIDKTFNNNENVFYSTIKKHNEEDRNLGLDKQKNMIENIGTTKNIYQKIADIFNSERYVYKANVELKTSKGVINTKVIGQNKTHLITIDNDLIPITDIQDINFAK